jgi:hypothetical protein
MFIGVSEEPTASILRSNASYHNHILKVTFEFCHTIGFCPDFFFERPVIGMSRKSWKLLVKTKFNNLKLEFYVTRVKKFNLPPRSKRCYRLGLFGETTAVASKTNKRKYEFCGQNTNLFNVKETVH